MSSPTQGERIVRSVLFTSVAIVSVMTIGIGYQQQTSGSMQAAMVMPMEEPMEVVEFDVMEEFQDPSMMGEAMEPTVWCCNGDAALCYEQAESSGCGDDARYGDFGSNFEACADTCASAS